MLVRDACTSPALTIHADTPLEIAIAMLDEHNVTMLPVVNDEGVIAGVLSEADVVRDSLAHDGRTLHLAASHDVSEAPRTVRDLMNLHPLTVRPTTDLATAVELMTSTTVKSLPVVDDGKVIGVISRRDVVHLLARPDREIEAELDDVFRRLGTDWLVEVQRGAASITGPTTPEDAERATARATTIPGVRSAHVDLE